MSELLEVIKSRKSTKSFLDKEVHLELIEQIVEAGTYAPTGRNLQSPIIVAVTNKEVRDQLSKMNASIMNAKTDPFTWHSAAQGHDGLHRG